MTKLNVKVFADGADIEEMKSAYKNQLVDGFTTNPSLMAKAGVTDYKALQRKRLVKYPTHQFLLRCLLTIYLLWKKKLRF